MVNKFVELYKLYMKGKRFMQFEQAWMEHIHSYFSWPTEVDSTLDSYVVWQAVVDKCECSVSDEDQWIVVSTMVYAVYDLMTDKVKDFKQHIDAPPPETATSSDTVQTISPRVK